MNNTQNGVLSKHFHSKIKTWFYFLVLSDDKKFMDNIGGVSHKKKLVDFSLSDFTV